MLSGLQETGAFGQQNCRGVTIGMKIKDYFRIISQRSNIYIYEGTKGTWK